MHKGRLRLGEGGVETALYFDDFETSVSNANERSGVYCGVKVRCGDREDRC